LKLLTIDTSTSTCSVALTIDQRLAGEYLLQLERTLTNRLLSCIDTLLSDAGLGTRDMDGFAVALGPGSFTGVRVGVATVKGLALAAGKPVVGFSSLAMLAGNLPWSSCPVCPMFDARKNEVYAGIYRCSNTPQPLQADCVLPPAEFLKSINGRTVFIGEGAVRYRDIITTALGDNALFAPWHVNQPRASAGALLAEELFSRGQTISLAELNPLYIRPSEAELARLHTLP
jgi:tRNA threonylcarbamoyladenosine biosynthesis protein TsaB